jgi:hypothetical protein
MLFGLPIQWDEIRCTSGSHVAREVERGLLSRLKPVGGAPGRLGLAMASGPRAAVNQPGRHKLVANAGSASAWWGGPSSRSGWQGHSGRPLLPFQQK